MYEAIKTEDLGKFYKKIMKKLSVEEADILGNLIDELIIRRNLKK